MGKKRLSKEEKTARDKGIIRLYESGLSVYTVGEEVGLSHSHVHKILKNNGVKTRSNKQNSRIYHLNDDFFEKIDSSDKAYWLGFMYADGYITKTKEGQKFVAVAISSNDIDHLEKFKKSLDATYSIHTYQATTNYAHYEYSRLKMTSNKMYDDLVKLGVVERKSNILKFPTEEIVPSEYIYDFIRGYIDGDGSIPISNTTYNTNRQRFSLTVCGTVDFLRELSKYFSCKTQISYRDMDNKKGAYLRFGGNQQVEKELDKIYGSATIYLDRKYEKYLKLKEQNQST